MNISDEYRLNEKKFHDTLYGTHHKLSFELESFKRSLIQPAYIGNGDLYSDNRWAFHQILNDRTDWKGKTVLDYGCGYGLWSIYFASTGAGKVHGFDLSGKAVEMGMELIHEMGLQDRVVLSEMDASELEYPDKMFDIVVGHAVLHHTIKYPGIFEHLYRVMKPGAKAYFFEGLADFPLWKLWWKIKGEVPEGDVPIFDHEVREKAHMFSDVEIIGDTFFHSIKHFLWRKNPNPFRRSLMKTSHRFDQWMLNNFPSLRKWGSFSYIILTK